MSSAREFGARAIRLDDDVEQRGHLGAVLAFHERVETLDDLLRRAAVERVRLKRGAELSHQCGRPDAAAHHVAHREDDAPVAELEHVEPVAAHLHPRTGGQVSDRDLHARNLWQLLREQAALQGLRDMPFLLEQAGPVNGKCHAVADELEQGRIVLREWPARARPDVQNTKQLPIQNQREAQDRLHVRAREQRLERGGRLVALQGDRLP